MGKYHEELKVSELKVTLQDFLKAYNKNMPSDFPRASTALLKKFKECHESLFKNGEFWSLDLHRKKVFDWLPQNGAPAALHDTRVYEGK